jgi:4-alpha-glucanotransferase
VPWWPYQLMLFERSHDGAFAAPESYRENALVSFGTHDLPTFTGWKDQHDFTVKEGLRIDPGETRAERHAAFDALRHALAARGLGEPEFGAVVRYLRDTPCRLLVVAIEDVLGLPDQVNVPGTIDEHPNWRRRLPVTLEELRKSRELDAFAAELAQERGKKAEVG